MSTVYAGVADVLVRTGSAPRCGWDLLARAPCYVEYASQGKREQYFRDAEVYFGAMGVVRPAAEGPCVCGVRGVSIGAGVRVVEQGSGWSGFDGGRWSESARSNVGVSKGVQVVAEGSSSDGGVVGSVEDPKSVDGGNSEGSGCSRGLEKEVVVAPTRGLVSEPQVGRRFVAASVSGASAKSGIPEWRVKRSVATVDSVKTELQVSLEAKWKVENEVARVKAERQLELLRAEDLDKVKRMQAAQVVRATETAKVQTEKAFGYLAKTGNVPGFVEGTVLTNSTPGLTRSAGDTISPDSSASMHEFRKCQKDLLDSEDKVNKLEKVLKGLRESNPELVEHAEEKANVKTAYTLDTDGQKLVDEDGYIGEDGKFHLDYLIANPRMLPSGKELRAMAEAGISYDD